MRNDAEEGPSLKGALGAIQWTQFLLLDARSSFISP